MNIFTYDGTLAGFFSCTSRAVQNLPPPERVEREGSAQKSFLNEYVFIPTDRGAAAAFYRGFARTCGQSAMDTLRSVLRHGSVGMPQCAYRYLLKGLAFGQKLTLALADPDVNLAHRFARQVDFEVHHLSGLTRFTRLENGVYYAALEPEHDVIEPLFQFFTNRMNDQHMILHDVRRAKALLYNQEAIREIEMPGPALTSSDPLPELWKTYFQTIAIKERANKTLQRGYMQKRYWKYLPETRD